MNLLEQIQAHAQAMPGKLALRYGDEAITYGGLWARVDTAAANLLQRGVQPGERVAWLGLNHPDQIILLLALARLGGIFLPLNYRLSATELQALLRHSGASFLIADYAHISLGKWHDFLKVLETGALKEKPAANASALAGVAGVAGLEVAQDASPLLLVYTSGTTGQAKGALHTLQNLSANCQISITLHGITANDHVLTVLPMFHVGGLCIQTLPALYAGASVTLHERFDATRWLSDVQALKPSLSLMVPATLKAVIDHPQFASTDLSGLRALSAGSSTVPHHLIAAFHARGVPVVQVYGATETGPVSIGLQPQDAMHQVGSAGRPCSGMEVQLVDEKGAKVGAGEVGEIWLRGPNVMQAYWQDTDNLAFQNSWFHTGDLARCDAAGFYWVVGRSNDMIISGGENIYPAEIENILSQSPRIAEVAVVGVPDERWGEAVVAVVVPNLAQRPGVANEPVLQQSEVLHLLDGQLARFKWPRRVLFSAALPKTALGKVIKAELGQTVLQTLRKESLA